jgi:putative membrane protein
VPTNRAASSNRLPLALLIAFAAIWVALSIKPWYRQDWLLENTLVFVSLPLFVLTYRNLRFSNSAYLLLFVFFVFHEIGAHYTYAKVPYDHWFEALTGHGLNALLGFKRNHYDRLVHFLYGLLLLRVAVELFQAKAPPRGVWVFIMPVLFIMSHSMIFEIVEWAAAVIFGGDLGQAYLGTQGDVWDAEKDMALASLGAVIAMLALQVRKRLA